MSAREVSPKLLVAAATTLAAACLAVGVSAVRDHWGGASGHARVHRTQAASADESAASRVRALVATGVRLRDTGRYRDARRRLQQALALSEKAFGPETFETAAVLNHLGMVGKYDGRFDESEAAYRRALRSLEGNGNVGLESELGASLFHNLGGLEHARGRFAAPKRGR